MNKPEINIPSSFISIVICMGNNLGNPKQKTLFNIIADNLYFATGMELSLSSLR